MATRGSSSTTRSSSTSRGGSTRPAKSSGGASRRPAPAKTRDGGIPLPVRAIRGTWMGVAHAVGGGVRSVAAGPERIEPEHRRDGSGLLLVALSALVAAREWWGLPGWAGLAVHSVGAGTFGCLALVLPLLLLAFGVRLMRTPDQPQATSRMAIGTVLLLVAACGIAHVVKGMPDQTRPAALQAAGGIFGFLAGNPLASAIGGGGALVVLGALAFLSLLIITATPPHLLGSRLHEGYLRLFLGPDHHEQDRPRVRRRRRSGVELDERAGDEAYAQAAVVEPTGRETAPGPRPGQKRPVGAEAAALLRAKANADFLWCHIL